MLEKFYEYLSTKIYDYFEKKAGYNELFPGDSFCLKLDDEEMVREVYNALSDISEKSQNKGEFSYKCNDGTDYKTNSIVFKNKQIEIVVAPQVDGMTSDFLFATLRNIANDNSKVLLMLSYDTIIDSGKSGSVDMSSKGMPFYYEELMEDIKSEIQGSHQLSKVEKMILEYELHSREEDVFSDKTSLSEYKDLLSIVYAGKIEDKKYPSLRLFRINEKEDFFEFSDQRIKKELKNNNELFEKFYRAIQESDLKGEFKGDFDDETIKRIEELSKKDPDYWSAEYTYQELVDLKKRNQAEKNNPLEIKRSDITVEPEGSPEAYTLGKEYLVRDEGSQRKKEREKNVIIFNDDDYEKVLLNINCSIRVEDDDIDSDGLDYQRSDNELIFVIEEEKSAFHQIKIGDKQNNIIYKINLCVISIIPNYMINTLRRKFRIDHKKKAVCLIDVGEQLVFNDNKETTENVGFEKNKTYSCSYDKRLLIDVNAEDLADSSKKGANMRIDFSGVAVDFLVFLKDEKSDRLRGEEIVKLKFKNEKSLNFSDNKIQDDSNEYEIGNDKEDSLLYELLVEEQFVNKKIKVATVNSSDDLWNKELDGEDLELPKELAQAYDSLMECYKKSATLPTLAFMEGELLERAREYIECFRQVFSNFGEGNILNDEQENALKLGVIFVGKTDIDEILFTPFHPLNIAYQLEMLEEKGVESASDVIISKTNSVNLLPYIQWGKELYRASDILHSNEWKYYALLKNKQYRGNRKYVAKLFEKKVTEFISHFNYIFDDIYNRKIIINLINMGNCEEIFNGLSEYYINSLKKDANIDNLVKFELHIYTDDFETNVFSNIRHFSTLQKYLEKNSLYLDSGTTMSDLEGIVSKNVECYFHNESERSSARKYEYAHISFYEMESETEKKSIELSDVETGISLNGLLSGVPSYKIGSYYRTGFGVKDSVDNPLVEMAILFNSLMLVGNSGDKYNYGTGISTQVKTEVDNRMEDIYKSSNWVVVVEPKVDLEFFSDKEAKDELIIIHYSDQNASSCGYDSITVTQRSNYYNLIISEYLTKKGIECSDSNINNIINTFNAINGNWLLGLVSSNRGNNSLFSREKISIIAAIKLMLAVLKHDDIVWIPISLEEMLRVSGGTGLSQKDSILSAKNLEFEDGETSDDILFVGINTNNDAPKIYLYPVEVKTGENNSGVINKAFRQVLKTVKGFEEAFCPREELYDFLSYKVNRNFLMQLVINSCEKMKIYNIDDSQNWDFILSKYRKALLNEQFEISYQIKEAIGKGAVLSFKKTLKNERKSDVLDNYINYIQIPESDELSLLPKEVKDIFYKYKNEDNELVMLSEFDVDGLTGDEKMIKTVEFSEVDSSGENASTDMNSAMDVDFKNQKNTVDIKSSDDSSTEINNYSNQNQDDIEESGSSTESLSEDDDEGMKILFGYDEKNGEEVIWEPNNTDKVFHTNTGIIGTMGTGKTQFTKSLVTQLEREQKNNIGNDELGILIFDYKGDYNKSKEDFIAITNATVTTPYHLKYNPLSLTVPKVHKHLLPVHTANAFKDTLSKAFNLGPKQQSTLHKCIMKAYEDCGIDSSDESTWSNVPPTFDQVYDIYENDEDIKKGDSLSAAMDKIKQFELFESDANNTKPLFELLKGVVVIDLSGHDSDIQNLIVAITLDLFYSQMQSLGSSIIEDGYRQLTKFILVDEADNFMGEDYVSLKKIMKEGREFGVGVILSTQSLKHFGNGDEDYSRYIFTWVVHNASDLKKQDVDYVLGTERNSKESDALFNAIKKLEKHHSIVRIGTGRPIYIKDKAFWQLVEDLEPSE